MLYYLYEMQRLWAAPVQLMAEGVKVAINNPFNPWSHTPAGRIAGSAVELVGHFTQRYGKPEWNIETTSMGRCDGRYRRRCFPDVLRSDPFPQRHRAE